MTGSFSFLRVGKLIRKQFFENSKFYLFCLLALLGLIAIVFTFWIGTDGPRYGEEATYIIFILGLFISGTVFASLSFSMLGQRDKGIFWLTIPATHFEKLLVSIFFTTVLFSIVYTLCFLGVKAIAIAYLKHLVSTNIGVTYIPMEDLSKGFGEVLPYFIYAFFGVQALYLLGSVYFSKYSFIVTTVIGVVIFFALGYYLSEISDSFFAKELDWQITAVKNLQQPEGEGIITYSINPVLADALKYIVQFAGAPILWITTWYRLKEKQI